MISVQLTDDTVISMAPEQAQEFPLLAPFLDSDQLCLPLSQEEYTCLTSGADDLPNRLRYADRCDHQRIYRETIMMMVDQLLENPAHVARMWDPISLTLDQEEDLVKEVLERRLVLWPCYRITTAREIISRSLDGRALLTAKVMQSPDCGSVLVDGVRCYYDGKEADFFANSPYLPAGETTGALTIMAGTSPPQLVLWKGEYIYHSKGRTLVGSQPVRVSTDGLRYLTESNVVRRIDGQIIDQVEDRNRLSPRMLFTTGFKEGNLEIRNLETGSISTTPLPQLEYCHWSPQETSVAPIKRYSGSVSLLHFNIQDMQVREIETRICPMTVGDRYMVISDATYLYRPSRLLRVDEPRRSWPVSFSEGIEFTSDDNLLITDFVGTKQQPLYVYSLVRVIDMTKWRELSWQTLLKLLQAPPKRFQLVESRPY